MKVMKKENVKGSTENNNYNQIKVSGGIVSNQKRMKKPTSNKQEISLKSFQVKKKNKTAK